MVGGMRRLLDLIVFTYNIHTHLYVYEWFTWGGGMQIGHVMKGGSVRAGHVVREAGHVIRERKCVGRSCDN